MKLRDTSLHLGAPCSIGKGPSGIATILTEGLGGCDRDWDITKHRVVVAIRTNDDMYAIIVVKGALGGSCDPYGIA